MTPTEAVFNLARPGKDSAVLRMQLVGGNSDAHMSGLEPIATTSNYLVGNDPRKWHTSVSHYARIRVEGVYPRVDLVYRGNQGQLEYDVVLAPHANPARIRLAFAGTDAISLGTRGELILHTAVGDLVQPAPTLYQEFGGRRRRVDGHFVVFPSAPSLGRADPVNQEVGFEVGRYDPAQPLVIDPLLVYSTFLGAGDSDSARGIAVDGGGNAYVAGVTHSAVFPGTSGSSLQPTLGGGADLFVTKINAAGTAIVYSTFLGGSGDDYSNYPNIAVDAVGNVYLVGTTSSVALPGLSGASIQASYGGGTYDAFVTKINSTGTAVLYSTFLGGADADYGGVVAVDVAGNAYIAGGTRSSFFPGVNGSSIQPSNGGGLSDIFVTKINATGTAILYSTFLGGGDTDYFAGIAVDATGSAYVTGATASTSFPGTGGSSIQPTHHGGSFDAFITKIGAGGTRISYSTFLGGSGADWGRAVAVDAAANAYIVGGTDSAIFPGVTGSSIQPTLGDPGGDAFVTKVNAAGTRILYSSFLGGRDNDYLLAVAVDPAGNAYVAGLSESATVPGIDGGSIQSVNGGGRDALVAKIDSAGTRVVYATFLGGPALDQAYGIAVDGLGNAYVAGYTSSTSFPGTGAGSIQATSGGGSDAFVAKIGTPGPAACSAGSTVLCLNNSRFQVAAAFDAGGGNSGLANVVQLTPDTGYLWFFASSNVEVVVKVLNGCGLGGHYWVFAGGLTDVNVVMTVTDTATGAVRTYTNPPHTKFQPIQDTSAFATCSSQASASPDVVREAARAESEALNELTSLGDAVSLEVVRESAWRELSAGRLHANLAAAAPGSPIGSGRLVERANGLALEGFVSGDWSTLGTRMEVPRISNSSSSTAGPLQLQLWATTDLPVFGQTVYHSTLATYDLGYLAANSAWTNVDTGWIAHAPPLPGCYYLTVALMRLVNGTYYYEFLSTFSQGGADDGAGRDRFGFGSSRCVGADGSVNLVVPSSSAGSATGLSVGSGDRVTINAWGRMNSWATEPGHPSAGPEGNGQTCTSSCPVPSSEVASLVARVGSGGPWFYVGRGGSFIADRSGALEFAVNDHYYPDNIGDFTVTSKVDGGGGGPCVETATALCLNGNRFQVTARFDAGGGNAGVAQAVQLTADTGYLWFFASSNVEVVVKVLNGCGLGGHYWVFAGGLTDVNVVMTVTDTGTGAVRTYTNQPHTKFQPIQDTSAFATCSSQASASPDVVREAARAEFEALNERTSLEDAVPLEVVRVSAQSASRR
ncbi:MAG: SBBP repeat-containing protein [Holophagales bacterium]|nr:MAG: SBBP repeat-containing protein [Holophagales bacterium]